MGLNTNASTLFSPAWVQALRGAPESAMDATVLIFDADVSNEVYDPEADTWTTISWPIYEGKARVQPLRNANIKAQPGNETTVQTVLISVPISTNALNFRPGLRANVLTAPLNASLLTYQFVLTDILDSSNPIERTLLFTVDQETVR